MMDMAVIKKYKAYQGANVAKYCGENLHKIVANQDTFREHNYTLALQDGFLKADEVLKQHPEYANESAGCTAVMALLSEDNHLYVANAGDSRAIISSNGEAIPLSFDHKPGNPRTLIFIL
jgi:protein phosphatase 2C family protein 2/3